MAQNDPLDNLASTGLLHREPPAREEIAGLLRTGAIRLEDALKSTNAAESRFDLAYIDRAGKAAHAIALAALRIHGFRAAKGYIVFQALPHTLDVDTPAWRLLDRCHRERNITEYEGIGSVDEKLLTGLLEVTVDLLRRARTLAKSHGFSE